MDLFVRIAQFVLSLSLLVVLHELGHYLPAKWFGTRVEKFYLFFDYKFSLFKRKIKGTEWGIGWIPLGGYVKIAGMMDESMDKEQLAQEPQPWEFRSKKAWQRLIIMLGGIIVNILVGFIIYIGVLAVWGEEKVDTSKMKHGFAVHPFMEQYGFQSGDRILSMEDKKVEQVEKLGGDILLFGKKKFTVLHSDGKKQNIVLPDNIGKLLWKNDVESNVFNFRSLIGKIDSIFPDAYAKKLKLQNGDVIRSINGKEMYFADEIFSQFYKLKGRKVALTFKRGDSLMTKNFVLNKEGKLGIKFEPNLTNDTLAIFTKNYSLGEAISVGFGKGLKMMYGNIVQFKYVFTSKGANSIGGLGSMGKLFPTSWDWRAFWSLTAFLSFMLAIMNLLPIPALDGGHVVFLLYEIITGRQAHPKVLEIAQYIGIVFILGLMLYANGMDIFRAITGK